MDKRGTNPPRRSEVEHIVREVLAQMAGSGGEITSGPSSGGELVLSAKVVCVAELKDRLNGISRLIVPRGAVFTPAARDELRKHQVAIASDARANPTAATRHLVVGVADKNHDPDRLIEMLANDGITVERIPPGDWTSAVDKLCERVLQGEQIGLLITAQTAAALCLANRRRGVRASWGCSVQAVADARSAIATNLLVIDPTGKSVFEIGQMARALLRDSQISCPPALHERLG